MVRIVQCFYFLLMYIYSLANDSPTNVLFLIVDDLRPEIGIYTNTNEAYYPDIFTPNINRLAGESLVFRNAYAQFPICGPSRTSMLTGRRPDTTRVYVNNGAYRDVIGDMVTLPQYFKSHGYTTYGSGKIFHGNSDNEYSWSEDNYRPTTKDFWHEDGLSWGMAETEVYNNISLPDMQTTNYVKEKLREMAGSELPFFIALGLEKPHLPLLAPREFFELYPEKDIYLPTHKYVPLNHNNIAWSYWGDLPNYEDIKEFDNSFNSTLPDYKTLELRRAYYASVSYTDHLIGEVLNEVDNLGLSNSTIIVLISDHGWQLGEHGEWAKNTAFELDLHIPMMVKIPGITKPGKFTDAMVEAIDIFPTLVDLVGLPRLYHCPEDSSYIPACHEGQSMVDLISESTLPWKTAVFSQVYYSGKDKEPMGCTIRTNQYRYTRWMHFFNETLTWEEPIHEELFDLTSDLDETVNVAGYAAYSEVKQMMLEKLLLGWRMALP